MLMRPTKLSAIILATLGLSACSDDIGAPESYTESCLASTRAPVPPEPLPDPINTPITSDQQLWDAMSIDDGTRINGNITAPAGITQSFDIVPELIIFDQAKVPNFVTANVPEGLKIGAILIQPAGTTSHYFIPVNNNASQPIFIMRGPQPPENDPTLVLITEAYSNNRSIDLDVRLYLVAEEDSVPTPTDTLSSDPSRWMISSFEAGSGPKPQLIPQTFGTGNMQVTLLWDQANDIDLWLTEPDENRIYYGARSSSTAGAGELDRDDTDGYGAENIFLNDLAQQGRYRVQVNYFGPGDGPQTNYTILVKACNEVRAFSGTLEGQGSTDDVFSFDFSPNCTLFPPPSTSTPDLFEQTSVCDQSNKPYLTQVP